MAKVFTEEDVAKIVHPSWAKVLLPAFNTKQFQKILQSVKEERRTFSIAPAKGYVFNAFNLTPFDEIKVVVIGQDPYPTPGIASGLAFGMRKDYMGKVPPSLKNMAKELEDDIGFQGFLDLTLESWAEQGVLLLNTCLTTRENLPHSHKNIGWQSFISYVLKQVAKRDELVWLLLGKHAQNVGHNHVDISRHCGVIQAAHPSPLSAHKGFFGSKVFSKVNVQLEKYNMGKINWYQSGENPAKKLKSK